MELYAIVTFTGGFQSGRTSIYYCPRCGKIQGGTQTPEQLFNEWEGKGIKFEVEYFYWKLRGKEKNYAITSGLTAGARFLFLLTTPSMKGLVNFPELFISKMSVNLSGGNAGVAQ